MAQAAGPILAAPVCHPFGDKRIALADRPADRVADPPASGLDPAHPKHRQSLRGDWLGTGVRSLVRHPSGDRRVLGAFWAWVMRRFAGFRLGGQACPRCARLAFRASKSRILRPLLPKGRNRLKSRIFVPWSPERPGFRPRFGPVRVCRPLRFPSHEAPLVNPKKPWIYSISARFWPVFG
jgi:hypothetical protein